MQYITPTNDTSDIFQWGHDEKLKNVAFYGEDGFGEWWGDTATVGLKDGPTTGLIRAPLTYFVLSEHEDLREKQLEDMSDYQRECEDSVKVLAGLMTGEEAYFDHPQSDIVALANRVKDCLDEFCEAVFDDDAKTPYDANDSRSNRLFSWLAQYSSSIVTHRTIEGRHRHFGIKLSLFGIPSYGFGHAWLDLQNGTVYGSVGYLDKKYTQTHGLSFIIDEGVRRQAFNVFVARGF